MAFVHSAGCKYFAFNGMPKSVVHGVFTRLGGVSPQPWDSLNLGGTVGDQRSHVIENRRRMFEAVDRPVTSIFDVWQVHSRDVICAEQPRPLESPHPKADAILTDNPNVTLTMRFADCVPIMLFDPVKRVVGLVHAGWQGTVKHLVYHTVLKMVQAYGSKPGNVFAGIGPSIGPDHYEVGEDLVRRVKANFGEMASHILREDNNKTYFDLWLANSLLLERAGVTTIEVAAICTACSTLDWYSHRAENGKTGRFGAMIGLK